VSIGTPSEERIAAGPLRLDFDRIRADVKALAAFERGSAAEEKPHVEWIESRLRDAGAHDVSTEPFRFQRRWVWRFDAAAAAGIGAAVVGGPAGAAVAAATLAAFELDISGRSTWSSRFLPAGEGANVVARIPAAGKAERTVVLVAHHDAQRSGLLWRLARTRSPIGLAAEAALVIVAVGCLLGSRIVRAKGALVLALLGLLGIDVARGPVVPGANDNASGVAALLALSAAFARDPLERTDVIAVFTDCEEVGLGGIHAWLEAHRAELDPATTLVVGLDTLGSGTPAVVGRDGAVTASYDAQNQDWADRGALRAGATPPLRADLIAPTDPIVAKHAGLHALSIVSVADDGTVGPHYHQPTDTPANVDWDSVEQCTRLAGGVARVWDAVS
jgi:acetylornithine deacetylase/succinyl-diaminopimelate desuccinylase-like protein